MTLARRIIPCLDVKDGRVVKGIHFVQLRDAGDPVEQAAAYDAQGADEICYLDISASPEGRATLVDVVARTAEHVFAPLTVGGGVRSIGDAERLLDAGADKIAINTAAIRTPDLIAACAARFGSQAIVVAIDAKRRATAPGWAVYSHGGRTPEPLDALGWCRRVAELGAGELLLTSMDRDGTGTGYDLELIATVAAAVSIPVIASGGAGGLDDFVDVFTTGAADAALAASIFHYAETSVRSLKEHLSAHGIPVRRIR